MDFFKAYCTLKDDQILKHPLLHFHSSLNEKTGEVSNIKRAVYKRLEFIFYSASNTLKIQGSIHKHMNAVNNHPFDEVSSNGYNGNSITLDDITLLLKQLAEQFHLELNKCQLANYEAGLNILTPIPVPLILDGLIMVKGHFFSKPRSYEYRSAEFTQFLIKCYDKGKQYSLPDETMRFELKWLKMEQLNKAGVYTLADLLIKGNYESIKELTLTNWASILFFDYQADTTRLSTSDRSFLTQASNANYWKHIPSVRRDRPKKRFLALHGSISDLQNEISSRLNDEWSKFLCNS